MGYPGTLLRKAPLFLSVAALLLAGGSLWGSVLRDRVPGGVPDTGSADVQPCQGRGAADSLDLLMRNRVNPTMTRLSYALHHDPRPRQERLLAVAEMAGRLLGCVELVPSHRPSIPIEGLPDYFRLLERMQTDTLALQTSAYEMNETSVRHWFSHLKHDYNECHTRFRSASEGEVTLLEEDVP